MKPLLFCFLLVFFLQVSQFFVHANWNRKNIEYKWEIIVKTTIIKMWRALRKQKMRQRISPVCISSHLGDSVYMLLTRNTLIHWSLQNKSTYVGFHTVRFNSPLRPLLEISALVPACWRKTPTRPFIRGTVKNTQLAILSQHKLALIAKNTLFALWNHWSPQKIWNQPRPLVRSSFVTFYPNFCNLSHETIHLK
jgi:hypothetical protein